MKRRNTVQEHNSSKRNEKRAEGISQSSSFYGLFDVIAPNDTLIIQRAFDSSKKDFLTQTFNVTSRNRTVLFGKVDGKNCSISLCDIITGEVKIGCVRRGFNDVK